MTKTTVIYHSADFDGIFCREIAHKFLPDAELIGWNFGDPLIVLPADGRMVYVLDLSPDCLNDFQRDKIIWIDHHKTSIEKWPAEIPGYRIDGVAACRLAWQWFSPIDSPHRPGRSLAPANLPDKEAFINRNVGEPMAVRLAGEYDIWDKRDPDAETLQYALRTRDLTDEDWKWLLTVADGRKLGEYELGMANVTVIKLLQDGRIAQAYARRNDASICESLTWLMEWEGLKFLCVNHAKFNSLLFDARDKPETGHDALLGFRFDGKKWMVSLYHAKHRTDLDLSVIAKNHGGGGHRGACGFTCSELPFALAPKNRR